jgi:ADP-heptose:LPS heptosyltransferase
MLNQGLSRLGLRLLDTLTDIAPRTIPRIFHKLLFRVVGGRLYYRFQIARYRRKLASCKDLSKILIIPDLNIGDSLVLEPAIQFMQRVFPQSDVHYVCNKIGGELLRAMPGVTVHAVFEANGGMPTAKDLQGLETILRRERFTVTLTLSPFLPKQALRNAGDVVRLYIPFGFFVVRAWALGRTTHISQFLRGFLEVLFAHGPMDDPQVPTIRANTHEGANNLRFELPVINNSVEEGNAVYLRYSEIRRANEWLSTRRLPSAGSLVFLNPDATSKYGQMPFDLQLDLINQLLRSTDVTLLVGSAYADRGIERSLRESAPADFRRRIHIVPHVTIECYAAIIDACDVFISSDGGPLHLSATRKFTESGQLMRNTTLIVTVHGATDSRMYGYDSTAPNHLAANQDAPSIVFSANAGCRNITCINKWGKSCKTVRCFEGLEASSIGDYIENYLHDLRISRHLNQQVVALNSDQESVTDHAYSRV